MVSQFQIKQNVGVVAIQFGIAALGRVSAVVLPVVLDLNALGELVGFEVIGIQSYLNEAEIASLERAFGVQNSSVRFSYDRGADALFVKVSRDRSTDQHAADATIVFSRGNEDVAAVFAIWD
jgi:uncharacterized protein YuzE